MLRTGMASRPWMRVPRKGRREAIGPRISEPLSSVQKSAKCLLHLHAYLVVVGSLPCFFPTPSLVVVAFCAAAPFQVR